MKDNQILIWILLAILAWLLWRWLKPRRTPEQTTPPVEQAGRAEREAVDTASEHGKEQAEARRVAETERARRRAEEIERARRESAEAEAKREQAQAEARRLAEAEKARWHSERDKARSEVEQERQRILATPIPSDIQRDMREFLKAGQFFGEEHSPLAYVGYKVGKTNGLPAPNRRRRLRACFQIEIPHQLADKYQSWGPPASYRRFTSMCQHITMLADMRRKRRNFEVAVADWDEDAAWFRDEYRSLTERLRRVGL
jgi:hypothetical protein